MFEEWVCRIARLPFAGADRFASMRDPGSSGMKDDERYDAGRMAEMDDRDAGGMRPGRM
jgi:hypothetical protein